MLYDENDNLSKSFRQYTREYNAANAFTSLGAALDSRLVTGRGPISFTIHGELRHLIGSLIPQTGREAAYSQLYIFDPNSALDIRSHRNPNLRRDVLKIIQDCLLLENPFSGKFKQAHTILSRTDLQGQNLFAYLHYTAATDRRRYNHPIADEIAVILSGEITKSDAMRDIILHLKGSNGLMQIHECHPAYLPLHYVLLFPHGELGWESTYKQWDRLHNRYSTTRLSQLEFYCYRIF